MKLLLTSPAFCQPVLKEMVDYAKSLADEVVLNPFGRTLKEEELLELWQGADGIVAGVELYGEDVLARAPESLKVISRYGVGYDAIDEAAAGKRGIRVTNTPGANASAVADFTLGLMISIARRIPQYDAMTRKGGWSRYVGTGLSGKTLGIIGLGAIGREVALRAKGFSMEILAYDPYFNEEFASAHGIKRAGIDEIYEKADFVSLHVPVMKETEKMINPTALKKMKSTAFLINAARGELVDEKALYEALKNNDIAGAALDVFEIEPLKESPLFDLENVVVTPHLAGHTTQSAVLMGKIGVENAIAVMKGEECKHVVNRKFLK